MIAEVRSQTDTFSARPGPGCASNELPLKLHRPTLLCCTVLYSTILQAETCKFVASRSFIPASQPSQDEGLVAMAFLVASVSRTQSSEEAFVDLAA